MAEPPHFLVRLRAQIVRLWNLPLGFFLFSLPGPVVGIEKAGAVLHRRHHQHLGCPGSQAEIEFKKELIDEVS